MMASSMQEKFGPRRSSRIREVNAAPDNDLRFDPNFIPDLETSSDEDVNPNSENMNPNTSEQLQNVDNFVTQKSSKRKVLQNSRYVKANT